MVTLHSIYELFISANTEECLLNREVFATRHNYFSRTLIMKNHGNLEPLSFTYWHYVMLITLFSRLILLCQSISNMCNWKFAIYLSFASNPKEKLKTSTRLFQVHHRRNKLHMCFVYQLKGRHFLSCSSLHMKNLWKLDIENVAPIQKRLLHSLKKMLTIQNLRNRNQPGPWCALP